MNLIIDEINHEPEANNTSTPFDQELKQQASKFLQTEIGFIQNKSFAKMNEKSFSGESTGENLWVEPNLTASKRSHIKNLPPYLASLYSIPLLTEEGERTFFQKMNFLKFRANALRSSLNEEKPNRKSIKKIESLLGEADDVRNLIAESNLRLVVSIARKFSNSKNSFEDLLSEGNVILLKAIEKFDYSRGFRFSTYATHAVQRHFFRVFKTTQKRNEKTVLSNELLLDATENSESNEIPVDGNRVFHQFLSRMPDYLNTRELKIVLERFGFGSLEKGRTLKSLADEIGISKERIRQVHHNALRKLQKLASELNLKDILD